MPVIFGHEFKGKTLWIVLAVIAAGVGLMVYTRYRAAASASSDQAPQTPGDTGSLGGGGGVAVAAPTDQAAQNYQAALQQQQLAAGQFSLDYQKQLAAEQQSQFDLSQKIAEATAPAQEAYQNQQYQTQTAYQKQLGHVMNPDFCPAGTSTRYDPNTGQFVCRNKSGGFFDIGQISSAIQDIFSGFTSGAAQGAVGAGQQAAQAGGAYLAGLINPASAIPAGRPASGSIGQPYQGDFGTPPIGPSGQQGGFQMPALPSFSGIDAMHGNIVAAQSVQGQHG